MKPDCILIADMGSPNNAALARCIRSCGVYSEIVPHTLSPEALKAMPWVKGVVLNGGSLCLADGKPPAVVSELLFSGLPVLTIGCGNGFPPAKSGGSTTGVLSLPAFPESEPELLRTVKHFIFKKCRAAKNWNMKAFIADQTEAIRRQVGSKKVLLALSGGVDSSVVAALLINAIGKQLICVHVNHGLMRKGESESVVALFREKLGANLIYVDAAERFLTRLTDVADPEAKRKIIGEEFIRVFEEEANKLSGIDFLAQGTIYPDIVESGTQTAKTVKSHHNVGGLPETMAFSLVEPLKMLFKDEVRRCGLTLGLPAEMVYRQPFPGPGLGVRCLGTVTKERLEAVRESDAVLREEFARFGLDKRVWQYFTVVPPFRSVGVRNSERCVGYSVIIRAVNTVDAMTAEVEPPDWKVLQRVTSRILAEVPSVNRVCYDLSPKPPATIEWE